MSVVLVGTEGGVFQLDNRSHDIREEAGSPSVSFLASAGATVFAFSREGAIWVRSKQNNWQKVNEKPVKEEVWSFAADPAKSGRMYLGVSPAMLYLSDDGGESWREVESIRGIPGYETWTFPPPPHIPHVRYISPDPQVAGGVYIAVEEGGIYHSIDGCQTWKSLNEGLYWDVHTVIPTLNSLRLYATTGKGFHRSSDGGLHWQYSMNGLDRKYTVSCVAMPTQPEKVFAAAAAGPPPTWSRGANVGIYRSYDGGENWVQLQQGLPEQFDRMVLLRIDNAGDIWAASGDRVFSSSDDGESWQLVAKDLPNVRSLAISTNLQANS
ncbi:exo-alpha-sialidase [Aerosakkonema funiforme]|uniref:exo-alpha-sialidase n=1 Tax=Aerosakkonema funiforme TaxID=1246630 RepID=UPI0035BB576B